MESRAKRVIKKEADARSKEAVVLSEVPESMKKLVRYIMRGFYDAEAWIVMEYLIIFPCIKEDDLANKLKIDSKQLRKLLSELSRDRLIQSRTRMELQPSATNAETAGRHQRQTYFYINYESFINVVKFRLDHVRSQIEQAARDCVTKPSFVCNVCEHPFTDLEIDRLFDPVTLALSCTFCGGDVSEHAGDTPDGGIDSRALIVRFNEQLAEIFALLREVENIRLTPDILQPPFLESADIFKSIEDEDKEDKVGGAIGNGTANDIETIEVRVNDDSNLTDLVNDNDNAKINRKMPEWLTTSTVDGRIVHHEDKGEENSLCQTSLKDERSVSTALEILLNCENKLKRKLVEDNVRFSLPVNNDLGFSFYSPETREQKNRISNIEVKTLMQPHDMLNGFRAPVFHFKEGAVPIDNIDREMFASMTEHETKLFHKMSIDYARKLLYL